MVNPINFTNSPENFNSQTEFENGTAIGMPPIHFQNRKLAPLSNLNDANSYNPDYNPIKRYHPFLAPSVGSTTVAYLKSRVYLTPLYLHDEAAIKYSMISRVYTSASDIKNNQMRVA